MKDRSCLLSPAAGAFLVFFAIILSVSSSIEAAKKGRLAGRVYDLVSGKPVPEALVAIQGTTISTLTDEKGRFSFDLPEGKVGISIYKIDYFTTNYQDIEIEGGRITTYKCELVPGDPEQNMFFSIGGITVLERKELLPDKVETVHEISSAEIEHQLSTNLGDILDIVPGIERTKAPGLSTKTQVELRGAGEVQDKTSALFGTKIMVDEITISNNANLQTGTGTSYGTTGTTAGSGIDLRTIPADNIESVEVITGVPSAQYGDLTTGLVRVKTKMGRQPHRLKIKTNPDTKEGNFSGGVVVKGMGVSYNANYAYSERDIRRDGDEYSRYSGQLTFRKKFMDERLEILNKLYYTGTHDEQDLDVHDPLSIETYNRDKTFVYGNSVDFKPSQDTKLEWTSSISYTKRDSYQQKFTSAKDFLRTDATEEGTYPALFDPNGYIYKIWTKGKEYSANAKLNFKWDFDILDFDHSLLAGGEYTFDDNVGEGKIFDPFYPPNGSAGQRPLSFDAVPALNTLNLYFEDQISGSFRMRPWSIEFGLRYEMYNPYKLNLAGLFNDEGVVWSRNGTFLNPRVRFKYELAADTQIRAAWGTTSKMPSMTMIFQGPEYVDVTEENVTPPDSISLLRTYVMNYDNSHLTGYQNENAELSLDQKIGSLAFILTGFYSTSEDMPRSITIPLTFYRYRWSNYPDASSAVPIDTIYTNSESGSHYTHPGWFRNYGMEFQILTKRIERISTSFKVTGSYFKSESGADGIYMGTSRNNQQLDRDVYPFYHYTDKWSRKMVVNYTADWFIKKLGMWVTFFVQQTLFDATKLYDNPSLNATAYYDPVLGEVVPLTPERSTELGLDRSYEDIDLMVRKTPNDRFLFNINVSKSIGKNAELSLFVHNVFDDAAFYKDERNRWNPRNHDIFYGVEFSMILDNLFNRLWKKGGENVDGE